MASIVGSIAKHRLATIYVLVDPRDGAVRYVGLTVDPKSRLRHHMTTARQQVTRKERWLWELKSHDLVPVMRVLETVDIDVAREVETRWIEHYLDEGADLTNGEGVNFQPNKLPIKESARTRHIRTRPNNLHPI